MYSYRSVEKPEGSRQTLLKEKLFIFLLAFLLHIEAIFGNYIRGYINTRITGAVILTVFDL